MQAETIQILGIVIAAIMAGSSIVSMDTLADPA